MQDRADPRAGERAFDTARLFVGGGGAGPHAMLASSPASILNHIRPKSGIPPDSINL